METVGAVHGVVVADDEAIVHDELALIVTTKDNVRVNPRWAEVDRISGSGAARHESLAKQRAFADLVAPIIVPARPA